MCEIHQRNYKKTISFYEKKNNNHNKKGFKTTSEINIGKKLL